MDYLQIKRVNSLNGNIKISGAKNASLPLIAMTILASNSVHIKNLPHVADINTLYGFSDVAEGTMSAENDKEFLVVDAEFANDELNTQFTLFEKTDGKYIKHQDTIIQHFYTIKTFQKLANLKLIDKQTFSLYDTEDKTLLIFKK